MQIRKMELSDLDSVIELENKHQHKPWKQYGFGQALRLNHRCMVVEREGRIIGYGVADKGHGRTILATEPRAAVLLYNDWFEHAKAIGAPLLYAETHNDSVVAISLLLKFGFVKAGTRPSYYGAGQDATVWQKPTGLGMDVQGLSSLQAAEPA